MVRHCIAMAVMVGMGLCATGSTAYAEPNKPAVDAAGKKEGALLGQAKALHAEGVAHLQANELKQAQAAFAAAWGIEKHYRVAGPLGSVELALKKYRDAAEHLHFFMENFPKTGDAQDRTDTQKQLETAAAHVVRLTVSVEPADAVITANGVAIKTGEVVFYEPGELTLHASRHGYLSVLETETYGAGTTEEVTLRLTAIDGTKPVEPPSDGPDGRLVAGIAIGAGAIVALGVGIGGSVAASGYASDVERLDVGLDVDCFSSTSAECAELMDAAASHDHANDVAVGGYVVGGVLVGVSVGLLAWWATADKEGAVDDAPATEPKDRFLLVPSLSPYGAGLTFGGTW